MFRVEGIGNVPPLGWEVYTCDGLVGSDDSCARNHAGLSDARKGAKWADLFAEGIDVAAEGLLTLMGCVSVEETRSIPMEERYRNVRGTVELAGLLFGRAYEALSPAVEAGDPGQAVLQRLSALRTAETCAIAGMRRACTDWSLNAGLNPQEVRLVWGHYRVERGEVSRATGSLRDTLLRLMPR